MTADSPNPASRPPHPLALAAIDALARRPGARVLEVGAGSGRNTRALRAAGFEPVSLAAADGPAAAALSSHALLHGTRAELEALLGAIARAIEPGAPLFATFGSVNDARYGEGIAVEPGVYAPEFGDEAGVAHIFFDEAGLRALLASAWEILSLEERAVDEIAGSWAHERAPLRGARHWFAIARRRV